MEWNMMELKVWFEGKTLEKNLKFYWKLSLYCQKIDKKTSVEWGRPPLPGYGKFHTFLFYLRPSPKWFNILQWKKLASWQCSWLQSSPCLWIPSQAEHRAWSQCWVWQGWCSQWVTTMLPEMVIQWVTVHNSILLLEHLQGVPLKMDTCFGGLNFGTRFKGQECFKICYALAFWNTPELF